MTSVDTVDSADPADTVDSVDKLTYGTYLRLDDLLSCQSPLTDAPDELMFVVVHQAYELWFKLILHEAAILQRRLEDGDGANALASARRIAKILKTAVGQVDILETMTPRQFSRFRAELGSSSGFQSSQFRYLEAMLGRRRFSRAVMDATLARIMGQRPVFASLLHYLGSEGWTVPAEILDRDPGREWLPDPAVQDLLLEVYSQAGAAAGICEALIDIDQGVQEWRYRHVKLVERLIGAKDGSGGSTGAEFLRATLFHPVFPDIWEIRNRL